MKRIGNQTLQLEKNCYIIGRGSLCGEKEKNGTYKNYMKKSVSDDKWVKRLLKKVKEKCFHL